MGRYYSSPRWSAEFLDCSMPVTFDTYSVCSYNCLYCFSFFQRAIKPDSAYLQRDVKHVNPDRIKKLFLHPDNSQFGRNINKRKTVQWGGLSDQFDEYERKYGVTLDIMRFFREIKYPLSFSTKATWVFDDDRYTSVIDGMKNWHFKVSIITLDEYMAREMERGVPSPQERLQAIEKLSNLDIGGVTLRLRPFVIGMSNPSHEELIARAAEAGADSVSTEFLCLEQRASKRGKKRYKKINEIVGFDLYSQYVRYSQNPGYLRLNRASKEKFVRDMEETCDEYGLRFYVSDAHFKERCAHGSCCGLPLHMDYNKGQFTEAIVKARQNGEVSFCDIAAPAKEIFNDVELVRAEGLNAGRNEQRAKIEGFTLYDKMRKEWNTPKSAKSPYRYFGGVLVPDRLDEQGDVVYVYEGN